VPRERARRFFLRRLAFAFGIVPWAAFLLEHIRVSNSTAITGPDAYARQVSFLGNLPLVFFLELFGICCRSHFTGSTGFTSGTAATGMRWNIPGAEMDVHAAALEPAGSYSSTSFGIRYTMRFTALIAAFPMLLSARCRRN